MIEEHDRWCESMRRQGFRITLTARPAQDIASDNVAFGPGPERKYRASVSLPGEPVPLLAFGDTLQNAVSNLRYVYQQKTQ